MKTPITLARAKTLANRWMWACLAMLVVMTALYMIGFKELFLPLTFVAWLCMARGTRWDGWVTGYKSRATRR